MNVLFLGPSCNLLEGAITSYGHSLIRTENAISDEFVKENKFDITLSYSYKIILCHRTIDLLSGNVINMHISMLPWNKGADPNLWSFLEDTPRGVSIHMINSGIDTGDLILQAPVEMNIEKDTLKTSYNRLSNAIERLFIDNMDYLFDLKFKRHPQAHKGSFHCSMDKNPFMYAIKKDGWDTPVRNLIGLAKNSQN